jgi:hypothetical protein
VAKFDHEFFVEAIHKMALWRFVANMPHREKSTPAAEHLPSGEGQLLLPSGQVMGSTGTKIAGDMRDQRASHRFGNLDGSPLGGHHAAQAD